LSQNWPIPSAPPPPRPPPPPSPPPPPYMALQSNADLRLLNGLLPLSSVFELSFQFVKCIINIHLYTVPLAAFWSEPHINTHKMRKTHVSLFDL
jgi:hypothetical protein